ncbi:MAG: 5-bromo-4-chloroindolyl phosphate hydrolysis family protein [Erysipelotrichaceae bacterium]|nr:5-bromo-4-chloroindolyl phosphate hydrolysis family protein [Erysipelotrichaceae bacterium]
MARNQKSSDKFWWVVLGCFFFPSLIPLAVVGGVIAFAINKAKGSNGKTVQVNRKMSGLTTEERRRINEVLQGYFKKHDRLLVHDNISLRTQRGEYYSLRDLMIYENEDCVCSLNEFQDAYPEMYGRIMELLNAFVKLDPDVRDQVNGTQTTVKEEKKEEKKPTPYSKRGEYDNAKDYITRINALNVEIPQEEITNGLYQMCAYLKQIDMIEENFPQTHSKLNKVYHYYLPILISILENYLQFSNSAQSHDEFKKAEDKLIKTIILINEALKKLTATLCEDELMNLNANMNTLEMLLEKDGLLQEESPFRPVVKEQEHGG